MLLLPAFQVDDKVLDDIHTLMDELAENKSPDISSESYKLGTIWEKAMDMASINAHVCPRYMYPPITFAIVAGRGRHSFYCFEKRKTCDRE
jgi:hypothetical protein